MEGWIWVQEQDAGDQPQSQVAVGLGRQIGVGGRRQNVKDVGLGRRKVTLKERGTDGDGRLMGRDRGWGRGAGEGGGRLREGNPPAQRDESRSRKGLTSASGSKGSSKSTLLPWLCKSFGSSLLVWPAVKAAGLGRGPITGAFLGVSGGNTDSKTRFNLAI